MRRLVLIPVCSIAMTVAAFAAEYPKGTYSLSGIQMCLVAPSGFVTDPDGHPTIPKENNSFVTANSFQGLFTYTGDGSGQVSGIYTTVTPPPDSRPAPKPSVSGGTFSYEVTTTPIVDHRFQATSKPGTNKGTADFGPPAGQQYSIDVVHRGFLVSDDQRSMSITVTTPYVETLTYSGSPDVHTGRSCIVSGNLNRMD